MLTSGITLITKSRSFEIGGPTMDGPDFLHIA